MKKLSLVAVAVFLAVGLFTAREAHAVGGPGPSPTTQQQNQNIQYNGTVTYTGPVVKNSSTGETFTGARPKFNTGAFFDAGVVINSTLIVDGGASFNLPVAMGQTLWVDGGAYLNAALFVDAGSNFNGAVFVDGGLSIGGVLADFAVAGHRRSDAGTAALAIETRIITLASGTGTYVFQQPFSYAPVCSCTATDADAGSTCTSTAVTALQTIIAGPTTATVGVICVGAR